MNKSLLLIVFVLTVISSLSCSKDKNIIGSDNKYSVNGQIIKFRSNPLRKFPVHITGNDIDETILADENGSYVINGLANGTYILTPVHELYYFGPLQREVTINGADVSVEDFFSIPTAYGPYLIAGKVTESDGTPIGGVDVFFNGFRIERTYFNGYYYVWSFEHFVTDGIYTLTVSKDGYDYTFIPPENQITVREGVTVSSFTALYSGPPLYSIDGKIIDNSGAEIGKIKLLITGNSQPYMEGFTDYLGNFIIHGLKNDTYTITISDDNWTEKVKVTINGDDVTLPDIIGKYTGPTLYTLQGTVVDDEGMGIPDIIVSFRSNTDVEETTTDFAGDFKTLLSVGPFDSDLHTETITVKPYKSGFGFTPVNFSLTLSWKNGIKDGGESTIPEFIGKDFRSLTADDYFPLSDSASWTYERTTNDSTVSEYLFTVEGKTSYKGTIYRHMSNRGPGGYTDFRIKHSIVYAIYKNEPIEFLHFGVSTEIEWELETIAQTYIKKGKFTGQESVETAFGVFDSCAKFELRVHFGTESYDSIILWFASGTGLVKSEKLIFSNGEMIESITDILKEYHIP